MSEWEKMRKNQGGERCVYVIEIRKNQEGERKTI